MNYPNNIDFIPITEQPRVSFTYMMNPAKVKSIEEANDTGRNLRLGDPINVDNVIKVNNFQRVSDPIFFVRDGVPTPDGLLSNEIFGITKEERANNYGYIYLGDWFMHPLVYKKWSQKDKRIRQIAHGIKKFKIGPDGDFVEDENGECGISFIKKNIDKIVIKSTGSKERDDLIKYINKYKKLIFMDKLIVLPAYYRDVDTKGGGKIGVGDLNKLYQSLIISCNSLLEVKDYGLSMGDAVKGRIQETILSIYNSMTGTSGDTTDGVGLSKKQGLVRTAVMSKTSDYGTRLVISAPEVKVETLDDMMVDMDHGAVPLASLCVNFMPFVLFHMKRFFENEYGTGTKHKIINKGKVEYEEIKDPLITFSEENLTKQIKRFVHGFSNRFTPVEIPLVNGKKGYAIFTGHKISAQDVVDKKVVNGSPLIDRRLTWCDVIYMAVAESVRDKFLMITRYPIDRSYNTIYISPRISTTKNMECVYVNGNYYRWYPKIREEDIGTNTSDLFIDTLQISNLHLSGMGGDYDGDSVAVKGIWCVESNDEIREFLNSKKSIITMGGTSIKCAIKESIQAMYAMTTILPETKSKLTNPEF